MKHCPRCGASYTDETLRFCLEDGTPLTGGNLPSITPTDSLSEEETVVSRRRAPAGSGRKMLLWLTAAAVVFLGLGIAGTLLVVNYMSSSRQTAQVDNQRTRSNQNSAPASNAQNTAHNNQNLGLPVNAENNAVTPTPAATPDKAQLETLIERQIKNVLSGEDLEETDRKNRRLVYGDLDNDGDEDAAVEYVFNYVGGNAWGSGLLTFLNTEGRFEFAAHEFIGEKDDRATELKAIRGGQILIDLQTYTEDDPSCCPSLKGRTVYVLRGRQLVETKK